MRKCIARALTTLAIGVAAILATSISTASAPRDRDGASAVALQAVDGLDRCIQNRFSRTDKGFGMSRMADAVHNIRHFIPTTAAEEEVVRTFDRLGLRVVMYLVSRQRPRIGPLGAGRVPPLVQGPVFVSPTPRVLASTPAGAPAEVDIDPRVLADLPNDPDVKSEAARIGRLADGESRAFDVGRWRFVARAVRASREECLTCHNWRGPDAQRVPPGAGASAEPFRVGDPLGAVLYAFQPWPTRPSASKDDGRP